MIFEKSKEVYFCAAVLNGLTALMRFGKFDLPRMRCCGPRRDDTGRRHRRRFRMPTGAAKFQGMRRPHLRAGIGIVRGRLERGWDIQDPARFPIAVTRCVRRTPEN